MGPEVLQALFLLFWQVEGCHPKPGRRLQLAGVNSPEASVSGEVEHLRAGWDVDVAEEPWVNAGGDGVHQRRPGLAQVLVSGHSAVQGAFGTIELFQADERAGPRAAG